MRWPDALDSWGDQQLGDELGVSRWAVYRWRKGIKQVPAERVIKMEQVTGIPRGLIRPDIYPD